MVAGAERVALYKEGCTFMFSRERCFAAVYLPLSLAGSVLRAGCGGGGGFVSAVPSTPSNSTAAQAPQPRVPASLPSPHTEMPSQADAFVNSLGVNIHLSYYGTP